MGVFADRADGRARLAFDKAGIGCLDVLALFISGNEDATLRAAERAAASAAVMGARWVAAVVRTAIDEPARRLVARCAGILAEAGTAMALEFSPLSSVTSMRLALELVDEVGELRLLKEIRFPHSLGLLYSAFTAFLGFEVNEGEYKVMGMAPFGSPRYVDKVWKVIRLHPDGSFELDRFVTTLLDRGFDGVVSVEVLNSELSALPVSEFARRAHDAAARFWW